MVAEPRKYRIIEPLGRGGFGTVYRAELVGTGGFRKPVALKILNAEVAGMDEIVCRLRDEARMLGLVQHPGIVHVDALVQLEGRWALVMEHVPGVGLNEVIQQVAVPNRCAVEIIGRVADALHAAHTATDGERPLNLVHRDMKPANIVVGPAGEVKLLDFGVARAEFDAREAQTRSLIFGSPDYMAPERWEFHDLPAGDVFSLGLVLFELLARQPFGKSLPVRERHDARVDQALDLLVKGEVGSDTQAALLAQHQPPPQPVLELLAGMLAFVPSERPSAREVEATCREIAPLVPGPWLRDWTEREIPRILDARLPRSIDPLSGATLVEPSGAMEVVDGRMASTPMPAPGRRHALLLIVGVIVALVVVAGVSAWLARPRSETPVAPVVTFEIEPPPTVPLPVVEPEPGPPPEAMPAEHASAPAPARPARKSSAAPPPTPPVSSATGRVVVAGGAEEVRLVSGAGRFPPGDLPAGSYTVEARFPGRGTVTAGKVIVVAGQTVTVTCDPVFAMCRSTQ